MLPITLSSYMATPAGIEPATSGVTGRRSNQLSYNPASTAKAILQKLAPFVKKEVEKTSAMRRWLAYSHHRWPVRSVRPVSQIAA